MEGLFGGGGKSHPVTVLAGIKNKLADAEVTVVAGPEPSRIYPGLLDQIAGRKPTPPPTAEETTDWLAKVKAPQARRMWWWRLWVRQRI